jgi:NhaA family Na+:H+ antiporter
MPMRKRFTVDHSAYLDFAKSESGAAVLLVIAAGIALVWANSPWADSYFAIREVELAAQFYDYTLSIDLLHFVDDFLMMFFFLVIGLEVKRELLLGELSNPRDAVLPFVAAVGGVVVPVAIFLAFTAGTEAARGWAIPMATDIAFALGVLALLGDRVPLSLRVFLTALAIVDDIVAVGVIALVYTENVSIQPLLIAVAGLATIFVAGRLKVRALGFYVPIALVVWLAVYLSGLHAAVAGTLIALTIPMRSTVKPEQFIERAEESLDYLRQCELTDTSLVTEHAQLEAAVDLERVSREMQPPGVQLEHYFHPVAAYLVLPAFAFMNAGVAFDGPILEMLTSAVALGIILGLVVGKQIGVTGFAWLSIRLGWANKPEGAGMRQIYSASWLTGIGFTMSLLIASRAFEGSVYEDQARAAVLVASLIAAVGGYVLMRITNKENAEPATE